MTLKLGMRTEYSSITKFVQMMRLSWPCPILRQGQIWSLMLLYGKKNKTMDISETIVVHDIKVGRCSQLTEYMKLLVPKVRVIHLPCYKLLRLNIFKLIFLNNHWF